MITLHIHHVYMLVTHVAYSPETFNPVLQARSEIATVWVTTAAPTFLFEQFSQYVVVLFCVGPLLLLLSPVTLPVHTVAIQIVYTLTFKLWTDRKWNQMGQKIRNPMGQKIQSLYTKKIYVCGTFIHTLYGLYWYWYQLFHYNIPSITTQKSLYKYMYWFKKYWDKGCHS